jgi:signal peptidase II
LKQVADRAWAKRAALLALLCAALIAVDMITKWATQAYIPPVTQVFPVYPYGGVPILPDTWGVEISLVHATNKGAISGLFSDYRIPLLIIRLVLTAGLLIYIFYIRPPRAMQVPLILIVAGAIGNVVDIFLYGHVIDMIHFRFWGWHYPIFNLADSMILIGVVWLLILSTVMKRKEANEKK